MHLDDVVRRLRGAGCVFAEDEAALLLAQTSDLARLTGLVDRRASGDPLEQVLGWAAFCGLRITLAPGVFVPRRRTELLVREAAALLRPGDVVVDLCCGSGAVASAIEAAVPGVVAHAADLDAVAVACARGNVAGAVHQGDLFDALPPELAGRVCVVVANAPYVPTDAIATMPPEARLHEPRVALDGGADGVDLQRRIARDAPRWLGSGGRLLMETSRGQVPLTAAACVAAGFDVSVAEDDELDAVVVRAELSRG